MRDHLSSSSSSSRVIWLVRHGERVDNIDPDWKLTADRWDDPPLSSRGHQQAREVGARLSTERIDHVFCSPFTRCVETLNGILSRHPRSLPVCIEPGLGESMNACANPPGRPTIQQLRKLSPMVDDSYESIYPDALPAETGGDAGCTDRIKKTIEHILANTSGHVLIVSHGSPIAAAHIALCGTWKYVGQCTIGKVIQSPTGPFMAAFYGDKSHLSDQTNLRDVQSPDKAAQVPAQYIR